MKNALVCTAVSIALFVAAAGAAEKPSKPARKKADAEEVLRMDPLRVSGRGDLSYSTPVAVRIIKPRVNPKYAGTQFELKFTVDRFGMPYNLGPTDVMVDSELVFQVIAAVRSWQFTPAHDSDGNVIDRKVILPVIILPAA
jgi:hypothetical protein